MKRKIAIAILFTLHMMFAFIPVNSFAQNKKILLVTLGKDVNNGFISTVKSEVDKKFIDKFSIGKESIIRTSYNLMVTETDPNSALRKRLKVYNSERIVTLESTEKGETVTITVRVFEISPTGSPQGKKTGEFALEFKSSFKDSQYAIDDAVSYLAERCFCHVNNLPKKDVYFNDGQNNFNQLSCNKLYTQLKDDPNLGKKYILKLPTSALKNDSTNLRIYSSIEPCANKSCNITIHFKKGTSELFQHPPKPKPVSLYEVDACLDEYYHPIQSFLLKYK